MRSGPILFLAALLLAAAPSVRSAPDASASAPAPANASAPDAAAPLDPAAPGPVWSARFAALRDAAPLFATFEERRFYPFRAQPAILHGELRFAPGHGLSLHYTAPEESLVIVDDRGALLRDAHGRSRALPPEAGIAVLLTIMRFDLPALARSFDLAASDLPHAAWLLQLAPRPDAPRDFGAISLEGHADRIDLISLQRSARQRIEIHVLDAHPHTEFSAADLAAWFRPPAS